MIHPDCGEKSLPGYQTSPYSSLSCPPGDFPSFNVRELFHVLQRAAVLCGGEVIDALDLPADPAANAAHGTTANGPASAGAIVGEEDLALHPAVARLEKQLITRALERAKGNRSAAARLLGIGRPLLYAKLEEHGIASKADAADSGPTDGS